MHYFFTDYQGMTTSNRTHFSRALRVVRTDRQTAKGILTDISTYDRLGNVLTYSHTLTKADGTVLSLSGNNTLDGAGRVKKWSTQFGDGSAGATIAYGNSLNAL